MESMLYTCTVFFFYYGAIVNKSLINNLIIVLLVTLIATQAIIIYKMDRMIEYLSAFNNAGILHRHHDPEASKTVFDVFTWLITIIVVLKAKIFERIQAALNSFVGSLGWWAQTRSFETYLSLPFTKFPEKGILPIEIISKDLYSRLLFEYIKLGKYFNVIGIDVEKVGTQSFFNDNTVLTKKYTELMSVATGRILGEQYIKQIADRKNYWNEVLGMDCNKELLYIIQLSFLSLTKPLSVDQVQMGVGNFLTAYQKLFAYQLNSLPEKQLETVCKGISLIVGEELYKTLLQCYTTSENKETIQQEWIKLINSVLKRKEKL